MPKIDSKIDSKNDSKSKTKSKTLTNATSPMAWQSVKCPLFVTWLTGKSEDLRGCIGSFEPISLRENLKEFALVSAQEDDRFGPITLSEVSKMSVCLSLLVRFQDKPLKDPLDFQVGKHGVTLKIKGSDGELYESTFLPEVAQEQNWTEMETLQELLEKAEFEEADIDDVMDRIQITTYESITCKMSYKEFKAAKASA